MQINFDSSKVKTFSIHTGVDFPLKDPTKYRIDSKFVESYIFFKTQSNNRNELVRGRLFTDLILKTIKFSFLV